ncbi:MAG: hypothetical protein WCD88_12945 [Desulfobacterales bacterium]
MVLSAYSRRAALAAVLTAMIITAPRVGAQPEFFPVGAMTAAAVTPARVAGDGLAMTETDEEGTARLAAAADVSPAHFAAATGTTGGNDVVAVPENRWQWSLHSGYRLDDIEWSFSLPGINPRSELTWHDVKSLQFEFGLQRRFCRNFRLLGDVAYAAIFDGRNQDSDFDGDNRTLEFSRSNNTTDSGDLWSLSVGVAYDIALFGDRLFLSPLVGYGYDDQTLKVSNGVQTVPPLGPFEGLDSSYDASWYGPWVGMDIRFNSYGRRAPAPGFEALFGFEFHLADFDARADWNLRPDLSHPQSFEQDAEATGWVLTGAFTYLFNSRWGINLIGRYQHWETDPGTHRFFFSDQTSYAARLNPVTWESLALSLGVICRF